MGNTVAIELWLHPGKWEPSRSWSFATSTFRSIRQGVYGLCRSSCGPVAIIAAYKKKEDRTWCFICLSVRQSSPWFVFRWDGPGGRLKYDIPFSTPINHPDEKSLKLISVSVTLSWPCTSCLFRWKSGIACMCTRLTVFTNSETERDSISLNCGT